MTTHETRSTAEKSDAIAGSAVATIVWSTIAMNIGSMIDGKSVKNFRRPPSSAGSWSAGGERRVFSDGITERRRLEKILLSLCTASSSLSQNSFMLLRVNPSRDMRHEIDFDSR